MKATRDSVTCIAPINIAVIKYWGKENEEINIPLNSSISVTLNPEDLCAKTSVMLHEKFSTDMMWLNGKEQSIQSDSRLARCLKAVRTPKRKRKHNEHNAEIIFPKCYICSTNNFPTAAGLASSAAGYACLAKCLGTVYGVTSDLSVLARLGSGSACRSMNGGFVKWQKGVYPDGSDSCAIQIAPENHWPELKVLILVVNNKEKAVGSTVGMKRSVDTSQLFMHRIKNCVADRLLEMEKAILSKDFNNFALLTMKDSNQLHAICQDTYPPIIYMNKSSHDIVKCITAYNENEIKAAYTFDAGSNAVLFTLEEHHDELLATLLKYFPFEDENNIYINVPITKLNGIQDNAVFLQNIDVNKGALQRIICSKPGPGASIVSNEHSLLDEHGYPKEL